MGNALTPEQATLEALAIDEDDLSQVVSIGVPGAHRTV
jgi:hypothetical protein